jgi:hypothetical protein
VSAALVRRGLRAAWRTSRHEEPPTHPAAHDVRLREAMVWALAVAAGVAIARVVAERAAAGAWKAATGSLPPDLDS